LSLDFEAEMKTALLYVLHILALPRSSCNDF